MAVVRHELKFTHWGGALGALSFADVDDLQLVVVVIQGEVDDGVIQAQDSGVADYRR